MTVYAIAHSRIEDRKQFDAYVAAAGPTFAGTSAKILAVDEASEFIEGELPGPRTVIVRFDSADEFHRWYDSPDYKAARKLREHAAVGAFVLVTGFAG